MIKKKVTKKKVTAGTKKKKMIETKKVSAGKKVVTKIAISDVNKTRGRLQTKKSIGYYATVSVVMVLGIFIFSHNDIGDDSNYAGNQTPPLMASSQSSQATGAPNNVTSQVVPAPTPSSAVPSQRAISSLKDSDKDLFTGTLAKEFRSASSLNSSERIKFWSSYIENSGGHREKIADLANGFDIEDIAPIVPKKYNCTTFVETVAALSRSNTADQFIGQLIAIRYKGGAANFDARNHLPELDWIPNNEKAGILKDITNDIARSNGLVLQVSQKGFDRKQWLITRAKEEGLTRSPASANESASQIPVQAQVPYIKLDELKGLINRVPDGTVINLVHAADSRHSGVITHQGFLIHEGDKYFLRHASKTGYIRSNDLFSYINNLQKNKSRWPVIGVNLNQFSDSSSSTNRLRAAM